MAALKSLSDRQLLDLKSRLDDLNCPYTDGLDQSAVHSLLFEQNDGRLRVLQWLFSSIDERILDIVDIKHGSSLTSGLLLAASSLCLCSPDDIDLIQGRSPVQEQYEFLEILIDLAASEDSQQHRFHMTDAIRLESSAITTSYKYEQDHALLTGLVTSGQVQSMLRPAPTYYPPDIKIMIDNQLKAAGEDVNKPPKPDIKSLIESAKEITERYGRLLEIQEEIERETPLCAEDDSRTERLNQQLRLLLTELSQLQSSVSCLYDSHLRVWCNKQCTEFTPLGSTVHRVHKTLSGVCKIFDKMSDLRRIYCAINQRSGNLSSTSIRPVLEEIESVGASGFTDVKSVISVLDQALVRNRTL